MYYIRLEKLYPGESGKVKMVFSTRPNYNNAVGVRLDDDDVDLLIRELQDWRSGKKEAFDPLDNPISRF